MDDFQMLKEALGEPPPPTPDAHRAARAALMQQVARGGVPQVRWQPRRRRVRPVWLVGGVTTAAALAAAVAVTMIPGRAPSSTTGETAGRDLLLAAAVVAESQPENIGTYWHVTMAFHADDGTHPGDWWTAHDGAGYALSGPGVVRAAPAGSGFTVAAEQLTLAELQQLPTEAAALTAWISDALDDPGGPDLAGDTAVALSDLLWRVPAPPAVRAAAFRALADLGNVTDLGDQAGNWALRIEFAELPAAEKFPGGVLPEGIGEWTMVIDPTTSQLVSLKSYQGTDEVLLAEWTDDMPPILESPDLQTGAPPTVTVVG